MKDISVLQKGSAPYAIMGSGLQERLNFHNDAEGPQACVPHILV